MQVNTKRTFRFFWKQTLRYKGVATLMLLSIFIASLLNLVGPYFYKRFFDELVAPADPALIANKLMTIIVIVLLINAAGWIFWRAATFANSYFQTNVMTNINNDCFRYMHQHSYNFFNNNFTGSLVKKVNRLVDSFEGIADQIYWELVPLAIKVVVIFGVLFWLHPVIGITMLVWTILFLVFNYGFALYKLKYDVKRAAANTRVTGALADSITNNINVKLFSSLAYELDRFKTITQDWCKKMRFSWDLNNIAEAVQTLLMIAFEFAIFYFAIRFWKDGLLTVGDFVWIQSYLIGLFMTLWNFGRVIRHLYQRLADAEEMIVILHKKHDVADAFKAKDISITRGKIEFKNVTFAYNKQTNVIKGLTQKIKLGEKVALIGPSGGGKSTITKLLLRLFDIQKGQILIDGQDISKITQNSLRSQISFVPQDPILFHRTLMENIRYGRHEASDEEVIAASKMANCYDFIAQFPQGYDTYVGERGVKLSGGERQRVAIARAILANAPILILDEATSSLDSESEMLIQEALGNLMKQKTTLVIAHRLSTIMKMDRIIVLQNGRIVEEGTHADLLSDQTGLYKKLWDLQIGGYVNQ